jgi:hypothetical protein
MLARIISAAVRQWDNGPMSYEYKATFINKHSALCRYLQMLSQTLEFLVHTTVADSVDSSDLLTGDRRPKNVITTMQLRYRPATVFNRWILDDCMTRYTVHCFINAQRSIAMRSTQKHG